MPFEIPRSPGKQNTIESLGNLNRDAAAKVLVGLQGQLQDGKGGIKKGVLALMNVGSKKNPMVFERKSWYQQIARGKGNMQQTTDAFSKLLSAAGASEKTVQAFTWYARQTSRQP